MEILTSGHVAGLDSSANLASSRATAWRSSPRKSDRFCAAHLGALYAAAVSLPLEPAVHPRRAAFLPGGQRRSRGHRRRRAVPGRRVVAVRSCRSCAECFPTLKPRTLRLDGTVRTEHRQRRSVPDALQLGHDRTAQGVVHTHANISSSLRAFNSAGGSRPTMCSSTSCLCFISTGSSFATHLSLLTGSRMLVADNFHPRHTLELVGQGTVFMAHSDLLLQFSRSARIQAGRPEMGSRRLFTCGSAPIRPEVLPELEETLRRPVINRYGMTEAHVITSLPLDGPWPSGSVGLPLAGHRSASARAMTTMLAPAGQVGSVQVRGPNLVS